MKYPRNINLISVARNLRKNMTPQERHLWYDFLRYCTPKFRRQEIIGNYIVDFFSYDAALVIEIDGSQHFEEAEIQADNARTSYFNSLGISVLRFDNAQVNTQFAAVCQAVLRELESRGLHPSVACGDSSPIRGAGAAPEPPLQGRCPKGGGVGENARWRGVLSLLTDDEIVCSG